MFLAKIQDHNKNNSLKTYISGSEGKQKHP